MIDFLIIISYFIVTILIGLYFGRNVRSIRDFAIADRRYSIPILVATITATMLDSGSTIGLTEKVFSVGIVFILIFLGEPITKLLMAQYIAPRMVKFADMISVGDMMDSFYGKPGRIVTGVAGTLLCIGYVGAQISAMGYFCQYFLEISYFWGVVLGAAVAIFYSAYGGIRAVTATDVLQFAAIIIAIPMICNIGLNIVGGYESLLTMIPDDSLNFFPQDENPFKYIFLFLIFCIPFLNPAVIQRLLMAKDTKQIVQSLRIAALIDIPFYLTIGSLGLIVLALQPGQEANLSLPYLIHAFLPVGIKGLAIVGIISIMMSTADSYLNAASIAVVHDIISPLNQKSLPDKTELLMARTTTVAIGVASILTAFSFTSVVELVLVFLNCWAPVVVVPLLAGIFDFKANARSFLCSVAAGLGMYCLWLTFSLEEVLGFGSLVPAMLANAFVFFVVHYSQQGSAIKMLTTKTESSNEKKAKTAA
ncbi:MAG: sodium:solute symporter family protein [Alphaproteobacteria bacterium]|jgi:solute:Na+ symporter, SSS family|nr:sodium:solute symporter family protein [Alphaproteobacteria bacterium]MBT5390186.1 sodium:solute symporter family protein [Alphaproteobacteria bacterium]